MKVNTAPLSLPVELCAAVVSPFVTVVVVWSTVSKRKVVVSVVVSVNGSLDACLKSDRVHVPQAEAEA